MSSTTDTSLTDEVETVIRVDGPVTDDNITRVIDETPNADPIFRHNKIRGRVFATRQITRQVVAELRASGFSPIELVQAIIVLTELLQVMEPIVKDLVDAIKKTFRKK